MVNQHQKLLDRLDTKKRYKTQKSLHSFSFTYNGIAVAFGAVVSPCFAMQEEEASGAQVFVWL